MNHKRIDRPLVSVIIPVYNGANFIKQAVESVHNQPIDSFEIILINDGSTDNSLEICRKLESKYKEVVLFNQNNQGVLKTRNFGIRQAKGDFLIFLDQDDVFIDDSFNPDIEKQLLSCSNDYDIILTPSIQGDENVQIRKTIYNQKGLYTNCKDVFNHIDGFYAFHFILFNRKYIIRKLQ